MINQVVRCISTKKSLPIDRDAITNFEIKGLPRNKLSNLVGWVT
ncbi:hypothetical protein GXM_04855 [Nostoc sphaeroides CCNUC1]|uniref:Uncharacterized protein n=1 Tax=Nostoc sphaeroides CCNUC1 TaxID=2653204 RepID=A0A5P8W3N7_9NOSO|nr:hypothetical protein GXM_04855 [Nostoc sphaeroides CCNUC1]